MATAPLPQPVPPDLANGIPHRMKGGFARLGRKLLLSLPLGLSGLVQGGAPSVAALPANPEPAYFKTGVLTLEDRIWAQTQIERVFYNHRIWPKENKSPKPPFEQMVSRAVIEAKVTDSLKKSAALDKFWQHPVTGEMLQAELDRMAKQTRDPATLRELFEALHNDPRLIAETLARETLSDRLIRNWYAYDTRFHAEARAKAEAIAARITPVGVQHAAPSTDWKSLGGEYHRQIYLLDDHFEHHQMPDQNPDERRVDAEEFAAVKKKYSGEDIPVESARSPVAAAGTDLRSAQKPPIPYLPNYSRRAAEFRVDLGSALTPETASRATDGSRLRPEETHDHFILSRMVVAIDTRIEIESIIISKASFSNWWGKIFPEKQLENSISSKFQPNLFTMPDQKYSSVTQCDQWNGNINDNLAPEKRAFHTAVWTGNEMIIWGGGINSLFNSGGRYNPATDSWLMTSIGINVPSARLHHSAVWTGKEMIIWGGLSVSLTDTGGRYNLMTDSWYNISRGANSPSARYNHSAVWTGNEMIIWGGVGTSTYFNNGGRYNTETDSWSAMSISFGVPDAREQHTAIWSGNEVIIWGGFNGGFLSSGGRYSPSNNTWSNISISTAPSARISHTALWTGREMIVWGGWNGNSATNSGSRYNPATDRWTATASNVNVAARLNHTAVWTGTEMIIWGGIGDTGRLNSGGRYMPSTDNWSITSNGAYLPESRDSHTAVWTGNDMIVWGGYTYNTQYESYNTGGRYSPGYDSWLPTSVGANIPQARSSHTALWTGSEMIIWGGGDSAIRFSDGGRYIPALNEWIPIVVAVNSPEPRYGNTAVWTGNEIIVWGGYNYSYLNSGGRYNPITDSWDATSTSGAIPTPRRYHTSIWSGKELIIWGGESENGTLNTGGRYNPETDTWIATSVGINVPLARHSHTAVWSGTEMLIWGGVNINYTPFNTGARYNPSTDAWVVISVSGNTPTARRGHTAIWTGNEMIIWGGTGIFSYDIYNSGGRYNPVTNYWAVTSTESGVPSARFGHKAIWSGSEMIIWGGNAYAPQLNYYNSGGRFNPVYNSWQSTSNYESVPSSRNSHTAIWTGREMIIWGGYNGNYTNTGGLYYTGAPGTVGNTVRAAKTQYSFDMIWDNATQSDSYNVRRCQAISGPCTPFDVASSTTVTYYGELLTQLSQYYSVEAVNQCGATP